MAGEWRIPSRWKARETPLALGKKASLADEERPGGGVRAARHVSPQESEQVCDLEVPRPAVGDVCDPSAQSIRYQLVGHLLEDSSSAPVDQQGH
jgi:hypothetical protein